MLFENFYLLQNVDMIATTIFQWCHFQRVFLERIERLKIVKINFNVIIIVNDIKFEWEFTLFIWFRKFYFRKVIRMTRRI